MHSILRSQMVVQHKTHLSHGKTRCLQAYVMRHDRAYKKIIQAVQSGDVLASFVVHACSRCSWWPHQSTRPLRQL